MMHSYGRMETRNIEQLNIDKEGGREKGLMDAMRRADLLIMDDGNGITAASSTSSEASVIQTPFEATPRHPTPTLGEKAPWPQYLGGVSLPQNRPGLQLGQVRS